MSLRDELIQVAAVAIAIVEDVHGTDSHTAFEMVLDERIRQNQKWGKQHHHVHSWLAILGEEVGEAFQAANDIVWPKEGQ